MATILRTNGFSFRIYTNDHAPAHVHVIKGDGEAIIELGDENSSPSIRKIYGMGDREVAVAYDLVNQFKTRLLDGWRGIHERSSG
ncbi:MAG: DUF4160 domain-containing protein [Acidobacteriota bacterium]|nr:DUF4160 domain-containing protein [Acidobacteriota bacterium]